MNMHFMRGLANRTHRGAATAFIAAATGLVAATAARAQTTIAWSGDGETPYYFSNSENWVGGAVPGGGEVALFDLGPTANYAVYFDADVTNQRLIVHDAVTFGNNGHTYTLTGSDAQPISVVVGGSSGDNAQLGIFSTTVAGRSGAIGRNSGETGTATVTGYSSNWNNTGSLFVGDYGTGTLNIKSEGQVTAPLSYLGEAPGATGMATVTGRGSTWNNTFFFVGDEGSGTLTIKNGGKVNTDQSSFIGSSAGTSGTVTVTGVPYGGAPSTWNNGGVLDIGSSGQGTLNIQDGAKVTDANGVLGENAGSTGTVTVTGDGSTWDNSGSLYVGGDKNGAGGTATLTLGPGGQVSVGDTLKLWNTATLNFSGGTLALDGYEDHGGAINYTAGALSLAGDRTVETDAAITDFFGDTPTVGANKPLTVGGKLTIGDTAQRTLTIKDGGQVNDAIGDVGHLAGATGSTTVTGDGSSWTHSNQLIVGDGGQGTLTIQDGGQVTSAKGLLGQNAGSTGTVTVSGDGSTWNNSGSLYVGGDENGAGGMGTLNIGPGGQVSVGGTLKLQNTATLNFSGGTLALNSYEGHGGAINYTAGTLSLSGDRTVETDAAITGFFGDTPTVGAGQALAVGNDLTVGDSGEGTLKIENGGSVSNQFSTLAGRSGSKGSVTVTGAGSTWTSNRATMVGFGGDGSLTIEDGGKAVTALNAYIADGGGTGTVTVSGAGSTWTTGILSVGVRGDGTLTIKDGATVTTTSTNESRIAVFSGSTGTVTVTGAGSTWDNRGGLGIGLFDRTQQAPGSLAIGPGGSVSIGGTLSLYQGATVNLTGGTLHFNGYATLSHRTINYTAGTVWTDGDAAVGTASPVVADFFGQTPVIGADKKLIVEGNLTVGNTDDGALTIQDGGKLVSKTTGYIGHDSGVSGTLTVTGTGSTWTHSGDNVTMDNAGAAGLYVGYKGQGTLNIENGAKVVSNIFAEIAHQSGASGTVNVTGEGSSWTINPKSSLQIGDANGGLYVGNGDQATLNITDGATVEDGHAWIGAFGSGTADATVAGQGSTWTNHGFLRLGETEPGTLTIKNGGHVTNTVGSIGADVFSPASSTVVVTGVGSTWTNSDKLSVSDLSDGTLILGPGGRVEVGGDYFQDGYFSTGTLIFQLAGTDPDTDLGRLLVDGQMNLDGTLEVDLTDGFRPAAGDVFDLFDFGSLDGTFAAVDLPTLSGGLSWNTSDLYTTGTLAIAPEPGTLALLGFGGGGLLLLGRRRGAES